MTDYQSMTRDELIKELMRLREGKTENGIDETAYACDSLRLQSRFPNELKMLQKNHAELEQRVAERATALAGTVKVLQKEIHEREKIEIELKKSVEEIQDLYNNAPCGYHSLDKNGFIIRINATELNWLGYSYDEIVGKKRLPDLMTPKGIRIFDETFPKFMRERET